jgi:hypothetical protein
MSAAFQVFDLIKKSLVSAPSDMCSVFTRAGSYHVARSRKEHRQAALWLVRGVGDRAASAALPQRPTGCFRANPKAADRPLASRGIEVAGMQPRAATHR